MFPNRKKNYTDYLENSLSSIDPSIVIDVVKKLKTKTSSGHDDISTQLVKETIVNISAFNPYYKQIPYHWYFS